MAAGRQRVQTFLTGGQAFLSILVGVLYFFFVVPRWPELNADISHATGTALRILTGLLLAGAGVPALLWWRRSRLPEYPTSQLAIGLRGWSFVGQFAAALLIVGTAIAEIWLNLDEFGIWLFGVYGAAAAIGVLAIAAFYLAFLAELPEEEPTAQRIAHKKAAQPADTLAASDALLEDPQSPATADDTEADDTGPDDTANTPEAGSDDPESADTASDGGLADNAPQPSRGLRNRRVRNHT